MESISGDVDGESFVAEPVPDEVVDPLSDGVKLSSEQCIDSNCDCGDVVGGSETD